ncbi:hypothetical protein H2248_004492 [Termitomyces sp. 'cryptogamus']|nr:hypothetical protein H2248_004492 [Termitomyces sp. 'cryptogamus']
MPNPTSRVLEEYHVITLTANGIFSSIEVFFYRTCRKPLHLYPCLERHGKRNARSSMSASLEKMVNLLTINNTLHADLRCPMASCISKQDLHRSPLHMRTSRVSKGVLFE